MEGRGEHILLQVQDCVMPPGREVDGLARGHNALVRHLVGLGRRVDVLQPKSSALVSYYWFWQNLIWSSLLVLRIKLTVKGEARNETI